MLTPFATIVGSDSFQTGINDLIQRTQEVQLAFGIRLFDVIVVLIVFLAVNKILDGQLVAKIKEWLGRVGDKPATPETPAPPQPSDAASDAPLIGNRPPGWKPGVEDVNRTLVAAGVSQSDSDAFVKAQWENIRGVPPKSVKP